MKQDEQALSFNEMADLLRAATSDIIEQGSGVMAVSLSLSQTTKNDRVFSRACSVVVDEGVETDSEPNVMQDYLHMHLINLTTTVMHIADRADVPPSEVVHQLVLMLTRMGQELCKTSIEPESKVKH